MNTLLGFPDGGATWPFGRVLRQWRDARHLSQLALATGAGISTRHLSFLETGRAQPSREMVQLLAGMLDVPFGERNSLLVSAGYAPLYGDRPLGAPELEPVRRALQFILTQQEPYPAFVVDGLWNIGMRNEASRRVFHQFRGPLESKNSHVLMPDQAHSSQVLMRARWSREELQRADQGQLHFTPDEVARIRARLDAPIEHQRRDGARHQLEKDDRR